MLPKNSGLSLENKTLNYILNSFKTDLDVAIQVWDCAKLSYKKYNEIRILRTPLVRLELNPPN